MGGNSENFGSGLQNEGLPNITGTFSAGPTPNQINSGAFEYLDNASNNWYGGSSNTKVHWKFDASKGETLTDGTVRTTAEVYGKSDHVTPENYTVKVWRRTA